MKMKKKIIIILSSVAAAALVIGGIVVAAKKISGKQVLVVPVSELNEGFWGSNMDISGVITSNAAQEIHLGEKQVVEEVFVEEGDTVEIGTPLLTFDMTMTNFNLESELLNREGLEIQKKGLEYEISRLKKQKPISSSARFGGVIPSAYRSAKDSYSGFIAAADVKPFASNTPDVTPEPTGTPSVMPEPTGTPSVTPEPTGTPDVTLEPTGTPEPTPSPIPTPTPVPVITAEECITADSEYIEMGINGNVRFYLAAYTEDFTARVTGAFLNWAKAQNLGFYVGISQENVSNSTLLASLYINGARLGTYEDDKIYLITLYSAETITAEEPDEPIIDEPIIEEPLPDGYTQEELNSMIKEKQKELRTLELDIRDCDLRIAEIEKSLNNRQITSTVNGVVKTVGDPEKGELNGQAFMVVESTEGLYVQGSLSELMLEEIQVGTVLMGTSWESGMSFEAEICEISFYPQDGEYYDGYGNSNASYYPFVAYIESGEGFHNNEYIGFTAIGGADESDSQGIYLDKMFIREEKGVSYVYVADEQDHLRKQEVVTKMVGSSSYKIEAGLTMEDRIAFPYGKNVKDGASIKEGTTSDLYNY